MPARKQPADVPVYQIKVTLKDIRPPIWRRIQVTGDTTLPRLHDILQALFEWVDYHLHEFIVDGVHYGVPDPEDAFFEMDVKNEKRVKLSQLIPGEKFKFLYVYDFGDDWHHELLVEKVLPAEQGKQYPVCLAGKRSGPPEDCGGPWGYADLLETLRDPEDPEYEEMRQWAGEDFDPAYFNLDEVNAALRRVH